MIAFSKVFRNLKISVTPVYSHYQVGYVWAYRIKIENLGKGKYELIGNYWQVPNDEGELEMLESHDVENTEILPGGILEFVGGAPHTECSDMVIGSYSMVDENGLVIDLHVPLFTMDNPSETIH